ncbi:hypothetical protein FN846DRAFT_905417 [Sphaerosporella brunnea]|uniref:NADH-ubiquinone oxidoreductase 9.5 kDa subunit n=1 Tax=Sphaerosporella brunnea TaxID=1250544 RepID=A0A5J5F1N8_9PEZI|nr:hypothetical protein FN846DRAFT_905417 [Sphaerosporella brunnea]
MSPIPHFWSHPLRYMRYAAHVYPARYYSILLGAAGPFLLLAIPLRHRLGYDDHPAIPTTWPIPNRTREPVPSTYDDPK